MNCCSDHINARHAAKSYPIRLPLPHPSRPSPYRQHHSLSVMEGPNFEDEHRREIERRARDRRARAWDLLVEHLRWRNLLNAHGHRTSQADILILAADTMSGDMRTIESLRAQLMECHNEVHRLNNMVMEIEQRTVANRRAQRAQAQALVSMQTNRILSLPDVSKYYQQSF
ncbi:hypothetical protein SISSUDRAFT_220982 [Sistotremastrum suecicum HHB10207 ss-3]|uniref:Uncharacterized protein n=1 Tax=Sistotremastrum suecicum HHB10207 ss-3 TaxID=1314776 RepID=A0A166A5D7_9AGAM|nr:hypothetical protein SISSUDRAFT_220982 [Sistotremastrum suecicum HHB10207 ss-3]